MLLRIIMLAKDFYDRPINSDIKQYEEIIKLRTGQGESYIKGCLLNYKYIKMHYRIIAAKLSRIKQLNVNPKPIQQKKIVGKLQNINVVNVDDTQSIFVLTILEKIKETKLKFSQGNGAVI